MANDRVQKFDPKRQFLAAWPLGVNAAGQAVEPFAIDVVGGFVYVFDNSTLGQRILVYDLEGNFTFDWGSQGAGPGQFAGDGGFLREWTNPPLSSGISVLPMSFVPLADESVLIVDANDRLSQMSADGQLLGSIQIDSGLFVGLPDGDYLIVTDQLTKIRLHEF